MNYPQKIWFFYGLAVAISWVGLHYAITNKVVRIMVNELPSFFFISPLHSISEDVIKSQSH